MACGRAQTVWTEPGRVATAYSADKYKDLNEPKKSAEWVGQFTSLPGHILNDDNADDNEDDNDDDHQV